MKNSFRWHLFIRIFIATLLVIFANRLIAQYVTTQYMVSHIEQNIATTLERCRDDIGHQQAFLTCTLRVNRDDALDNVSEFFVLCGTKDTANSSQEKACIHARSVRAARPAESKDFSKSVELMRQIIDGEDWLVFSLKQAPTEPHVMIRQTDVLEYIESIYNLRKRVFNYVMPFIVLTLALMTWYMITTVMRPIRQLENSLAGLTSRNLDQPIDVLPPYREFARFLGVFEQLRERLSLSFLQARRFAADASHELRTPLTILRGNSERLIAELPTGSEAQVRMRLIGDEIERLIEITEKLLLLSRADVNGIRYDMEPVLLSTLVTELALDAVSFYPHLKIYSEIEPDIIAVCDRSLIQQLLYNLYTNAAKYNAGDGWIRFSLARRENRFVFSVENSCDNVPADLAERAFQRFYRGDSAHGRQVDGVGLGLSLCKEIARLHDATLSLQVHGGSVVVTTLEGPLALATAGAKAA